MEVLRWLPLEHIADRTGKAHNISALAMLSLLCKYSFEKLPLALPLYLQLEQLASQVQRDATARCGLLPLPHGAFF